MATLQVPWLNLATDMLDAPRILRPVLIITMLAKSAAKQMLLYIPTLT